MTDRLAYEDGYRLRDLVDFRYLGVSLHDGSRHVMRLHILETSDPAVRQFESRRVVEYLTENL